MIVVVVKRIETVMVAIIIRILEGLCALNDVAWMKGDFFVSGLLAPT